MTRPGLQPQRTSLAWNRTALAGLALLGVVLKAAADQPDVRTIMCAMVVTVQAAALAACGRARSRTEARSPGRGLILFLGTGTSVTCLSVAVLLAPGW